MFSKQSSNSQDGSTSGHDALGDLTAAEVVRRRRETAKRRFDGQRRRLSRLIDNNAPLEQLRVSFSALSECKITYQDAHDELEICLGAVNTAAETTELDGDLDAYETFAVTIASREAASQVAPTSQVGRVSQITPAVRSIFTFTPESLPSFEGDPLEFVAFWDRFKGEVHENTELSDARKFGILSSCLRGPPKEMIRGLSQTDANYGVAVDLLFSRYHDARVVVEAHVSAMLDLEITGEPGKEGKVDLTSFYDKCEAHVRALKALERDVDAGVDAGGLPPCEVIVPILKRKLPEGTRRKWEVLMLKETSEASVGRFLKFLKEEVRLEERMKMVNAQPKSQDLGTTAPHRSLKYKGKRNRKRSGEMPEDPDVSAAFAGSILRRCPFCEKECHEKIEQCKAVSHIAHSLKLFLIRRYGLCYLCMVSKHLRAECKAPGCGVADCKYRHHKLLHLDPIERYTEVPTKEVKGNAAASSGRGTGILQTVLAELISPEGSFTAPVLLDPGSDSTFIKASFAERAGLDGKSQRVYLDTVGTGQRLVHSKALSFQLAPVGDKGRAKKVSALALKHVASIANTQKVRLDRFSHLRNLTLAPQPSEGCTSVDILLGADYYYDFLLPGQFVTGRCGEPAGIGTIFGWIIGGPNPTQGRDSILRIRTCQAELCEDSANAAVERFWKFEDGGISDSVAQGKGKSIEVSSDKVHEAFKESTQLIGNRYEVRLPWKDDSRVLPNNFEVAHECLQRSERRHRRNPKAMEAYDRAIQEYTKLGFAEVVPEDDISGRSEQPSKRIWYLPHHAVIREDRETTKVRIVFNGAAKYEGVSLNENLHTGPNLLPSILGVLLRFRCKAVAVTADIKKMFLQIAVHPSDRDALRYLWRDPEGRLLVLRFIRVIFGTNCSPFLAIGTVQFHCDRKVEQFPQACTEVKRNMYMDDLASGADTVKSANKLVHDCRQLMLDGGFELTKWTSNSPEALEGIAREDQASVMQTSPEERTQKILGVTWKLTTDVLGVQKESTEPPPKFSKRSLLHDVASIFDPIGLVSPYATTGRILLQSCWRRKTGWDEELPPEIQNQYTSWREGLEEICKVQVPRYLFHHLVKDTGCIELHGFGDASGKAYGSVVYMKYAVA